MRCEMFDLINKKPRPSKEDDKRNSEIQWLQKKINKK